MGPLITLSHWILGDVVYLHVHASGFPSEFGLGGFWFDAEFDPTQLQLTSGTEVNLGDWSSGYVFYSNDGGYVEMGAYADDGGMTGDSYLLGTIELHCIAPGVSYLDFYGDWWPVDEWSESFPGLSVEIINTPVPPAVLLLGSGLMGLVGFRLRRMK